MAVNRSPNFFVLGFAKCGTTTIYHLLKQHPEIYLPEEKEPRFFDTDALYNRGIEYYLETYFKGSQAYLKRGEASPAYSVQPELVAPRILDACGEDVQMIVIMRDPVSRLWSHYLHQVRNCVETLSIEEALQCEEKRIQEGKPSWVGYFTDGRYPIYLEKWFEYFSKERFLLLLTDDLEGDPVGTMQRIYSFLGVDQTFCPELSGRYNTVSVSRYPWLARLLNRPNALTNLAKHAFPYPLRKRIRDLVNEKNRRSLGAAPVMDPQLAADMRLRYRDDIIRLQEILGRDLGAWLR